VRAPVERRPGGITETLGGAIAGVRLDGDGQFKTSLEKVRRHLRESKASRILVGAANDSSALGAAAHFKRRAATRTVRLSGRTRTGRPRRAARPGHVAGGVGRLFSGALRRGSDPARARHPRPPAGPARRIRRHQVITADNVDHFYPNDALLRAAPLTAHGVRSASIEGH